MSIAEEIFQEVSPLKPLDKLQLVDKILSSLHVEDPSVTQIWVKEAEARIVAYDQGRIGTVAEEDVFGRYGYQR